MDDQFLEVRIEHAVDQMRRLQFQIDSHFSRIEQHFSYIEQYEREINGWSNVLLTLNAMRDLRQLETRQRTDAEAEQLLEEVWPDG